MKTFASIMLEAALKVTQTEDPSQWDKAVYQAMIAGLKEAGIEVTQAGTVRKDTATDKLIAEDWSFSYKQSIGMKAFDRDKDTIQIRRCHFEQQIDKQPTRPG